MDHVLLNYSSHMLNAHWHSALDETILRAFLRRRFNFQAKDYIRHITPTLLIKQLIKTKPENVAANRAFEIRLIHKRGKTAEDYKVERLVTFNPHACSNVNLVTQPDDEDWNKYTNRAGVIWDPAEHLETEILDCFLEHGLGAAEMVTLEDEAAKPKTRKRKSTIAVEKDDESVELPSTRAPKRPRTKAVTAADAEIDALPAHQRGITPGASLLDGASAITAASQRKSAPKKTSAAAKKNASKATGSQGVDRSNRPSPSSTQPSGFRLPSALQNLTVPQLDQLHREGV